MMLDQEKVVMDAYIVSVCIKVVFLKLIFTWLLPIPSQSMIHRVLAES